MKYRVTIPYACFVTVEVEADSEDAAEELAFEEGYISQYCGNGGCDKLIGVAGGNCSIEASDAPLDCDGFQVEISEA